MCFRIAKLAFIMMAIFSALAIFLPWQRLLFLSDDEAMRLLPAKLILLPVFTVCVLGAMWAGKHAHSDHL